MSGYSGKSSVSSLTFFLFSIREQRLKAEPIVESFQKVSTHMEVNVFFKIYLDKIGFILWITQMFDQVFRSTMSWESFRLLKLGGSRQTPKPESQQQQIQLISLHWGDALLLQSLNLIHFRRQRRLGVIWINYTYSLGVGCISLFSLKVLNRGEPSLIKL